jgi:hypothetical protein
MSAARGVVFELVGAGTSAPTRDEATKANDTIDSYDPADDRGLE